MGRVRVTVSVPEEVATYLRLTPNASAVVAEAVRRYRVDELRRELADAYEADREEAAALHEEWAAVDPEVEE
jgi:hypothetical protein